MCVQCFERAALEAMKKKSEELGIDGVAAILTIDNENVEPGAALDPVFLICGEFQRDPSPQCGKDDRETNYLAIVFSKISEMVRTGVDSGTHEKHRHGEFGYRGGIVRYVYNLTVLIAFSGATAEMDLEVAEAGFATFDELAQNEVAARKAAMEEVQNALAARFGYLVETQLDID